MFYRQLKYLSFQYIIIFSAVQRSDSVGSNTKRKISSISASDTSDHEATETEAVQGEDKFFFYFFLQFLSKWHLWKSQKQMKVPIMLKKQ